MNKNLKSILAAVAIFFAVAACGGKNENSAEATDNAGTTESSSTMQSDTTQTDTTSQVAADTTAAKQ